MREKTLTASFSCYLPRRRRAMQAPVRSRPEHHQARRRLRDDGHNHFVEVELERPGAAQRLRNDDAELHVANAGAFKP